MNCDQIAGLLKACSHISVSDTVYTVTETAIVDVLLKAGNSGPLPISRVKKVTLHGDYVELETEENTYLFPPDAIFGLKWTAKETRLTRTGFHA
jgi:hypothetical protein